MTESATVLVVEDERELADLFAAWLADAHDVRTAYTADDALEALDESVDVVLLDRRLPDSSGDDVLSAIRERGYDCQVAMVSAVDPDFDILDMGFDAYVVKPVDRDELRDVVDRLLARSIYSEEVREYYALASKRASLEVAKSPEELAGDERYEELCAELERVRAELDETVAKLGDDDFLAVLHDLREHED